MKNILIASTVILTGIVIFQFKQGSDLKQENKELRQAAEARSSGFNSSSGASHNGGRTGRGTHGDTNKNRAGSVKDLLAIKDPSDRIEAIMAYVKSLSAAELPAALEELRSVSPHWDQEGKMLAHILLSRWARVDPEGALASLNNVDFKRHREAPFSVLSAIAAHDPQRAIKWLNNPDNPLAAHKWFSPFLAGTISKEWVRQDPEAALEWAGSLTGRERGMALSGALGSIAMTDPKRASQLAMELDPGDGRSHVIGEIAQAWAVNAPKEALAWAEGLTDDEERSHALNTSVRAWAQQSPSDAAAYVTDAAKSATAEDASRLIGAVTDGWVNQQPDSAAKWIASLETESGARAMGNAMWHWTNRNPEDAATWLADQPTGPVRDSGITGLAKASFEFDRPAALAWSQEIENEQLRQASTRIGLHAWSREEPEAAAKWAQDNGVEMPPVPLRK